MNLYKVAIITLFVLIPLRGFETAGQDKHWLSYEPAIVELEGKLIEIWKYGPPGFGEDPKHDEKVRVPILVLIDSINVRADPGHPENAEVKGVRRIQLMFYEVHYGRFFGKRVVVKGTLFYGNTGGHYTDVLMVRIPADREHRFRFIVSSDSGSS